MSVQYDTWIKKIAKKNGMISQFENKQVRETNISFGT